MWVAITAVPAGALERLPAVVHVHSTLSTGTLSLEDLAALAEREGVGALLLSENYLLRFEYGLSPFRSLTRVAHEEPSVLDSVDHYLARVAEVRRRFPRLVVVSGVEVVPHYHWTGTPFLLGLDLHDTQKNVLVFGLENAAALRALPATGNPSARQITAQSLIELLPALLIAPGVFLLVRPRVRRVRLGTAVMVVRQRRWLVGAAVLLLGVVAVVRAWPFGEDRYPPWRDFGLDPHQAVIDEAARRGGITMWSFPEASDMGERHVGPVRVTWRTDPYPDDLLRTSGYTAFGAVYEQPTRFTRPGDGWDRLLVQYVAGERAQPVWGVGETGFHGPRTGKRLGAVQTVFLVEERSPAAVLQAFKRGRLYALRRSGDATLVLSEFAAAVPGSVVGSGETLAAAPGALLEVTATVEAARGAAHPVRVNLVKNGEVAATWTGVTPLRVVHRDTAAARRVYYRLEARVSTADYLLSNPVFVAP